MRNNKNKNKKRILLNIFINVIIICVSVVYIIKSFNLPTESVKKNVYFYKINKEAKSKIYIKENDFIENNFIEDSNITYMSELVQYIYTTFKYVYNANKDAQINYNYNVTAKININYLGTEEDKEYHLWTKEYKLLDENNNIYGNKIVIEEPIKIDYNEYNNIVKNFKDKFNLPIEAYLEIKFQVKSNVETTENSDNKSNDSQIILKMDLEKPIFYIEKNNIGDDENNIYEMVPKIEKTNILIISICIIAFIIGFINIIYNIKKLFNIRRKTKYEKTINKILKDYGDIAIEIINPIETKNMKIIEVKSFEEILAIEEEVRIPILFYENIKGKEGTFSIIQENMIYQYILKKYIY